MLPLELWSVLGVMVDDGAEQPLVIDPLHAKLQVLGTAKSILEVLYSHTRLGYAIKALRTDVLDRARLTDFSRNCSGPS